MKLPHLIQSCRIICVLFLVAAFWALPANASLITVINTGDTGVGSLRSAITSAGAGDMINFATNVTGSIAFTNGPIVIDKSLTILGPGARTLAISGVISNIFNVSNGVVLIANLSLTNGFNNSGGAIRLTGGALTISNCIVSGNTAPPGTGGVGGAINATGGSLAVIASTFSGNRAHFGGAIYNNGAQVALSNSTFTANEVTAGADSAGAGIYNNSTLTVQSCTVASNLVTSGSGFGGGIFNLATVHLRNNIVVGNSAPTGRDLNGTFISNGYNLIGTNSASTGLTNGVNNDLVGTTNARLGALQDNGGPTPTMALLAGSPAIDKGISGGLAADQRGQSRTFDHLLIPNASGGDGTDIGAYEATFIVMNTNDSGAGSLRQAILDNNAFGGNTITFSSGVTGAITLASVLEITTDATILGPGAKVLTVSGNAVDRVFALSIGAVSISGLTIANGYSGSGAGIFSSTAFSLLTIQSCVFSNNISATGGGGALYLANPCAILNSTFRNNKAFSSTGGGAIYSVTSLVGITNCTFVGNSATNAVGRGGAIYNLNSTFNIYGCTIVSNVAGSSGAGIFGNSSIFVRNSIIALNTAPTNPDVGGNISSTGYNFIGNAGTTTGWSTGIGDQVGSGAFPINPLLGPLQDNGGPAPTLAPLTGSPTIDKGKTAVGATDQRGRFRPFDFVGIADATGGDGSDIGAVEVSPNPQLEIDRANPSVILSWPAYYADFILETAGALPTSNSWTTSLDTRYAVGNQWHVTNSTASGQSYFRLRAP